MISSPRKSQARRQTICSLKKRTTEGKWKGITKCLQGGVFAAVSATSMFLCCSCSTIEWVDVGYLTPASDVPLKKSPVVDIVCVDKNEMTSTIAQSVKKLFAESDQFTIADSEKSPDYLIVLSGESQYRKDTENEKTYNKVVTKIAEKNDSGGEEKILVSEYDSSASSGVINVAVYSIKNLSPIASFDISGYDSEFKPKSEGIRDAAAYDEVLFSQIVEKLNDAFSIQKRISSTVFPERGDSELKRLVKAGRTADALERAKNIQPLEFDAFVQNINDGKYAEGDKWYSSVNALVEEKLCNYYVIAIAEEIDDYSPANLKRLHDRHLAILNLTNDDDLMLACPDSLARIERKLKQSQESSH